MPAEHDADALRPIEIEGEVVRRPAAAWTPTVHAYLDHLRSRGVDCVPVPLGIDDDTETPGYLHGPRAGTRGSPSTRSPASPRPPGCCVGFTTRRWSGRRRGMPYGRRHRSWRAATPSA